MESPPPPPPPPSGTSPPPPSPEVEEPAVDEAANEREDKDEKEAADWQADWESDQTEEGEDKPAVDDTVDEAARKDWIAKFAADYNSQIGTGGRTGPAAVARTDSRRPGGTVGESDGGSEAEQEANEKLAGVSPSFARVARDLGLSSTNQQACAPNVATASQQHMVLSDTPEC